PPRAPEPQGFQRGQPGMPQGAPRGGPPENFQRGPAGTPGEGANRGSPPANFQRGPTGTPGEGINRGNPSANFQRPPGEGANRGGSPQNFQRGPVGPQGGMRPRPGPGGFGHGPTPSRIFVGHPTPAGAREFHTSNGNVVRVRAGGGFADIRDPRRGMDIHRGLNGSRVVIVDRPDHSRVFVAHGGYGYVQHPYVFHGHEFAQRTYWDHGHAYVHYY